MTVKTKKSSSLYDLNVRAPSALDLNEDASSTDICRWWERAKLYAEAMNALGRAVLLVRDEDAGMWYLSSVEEEA